MPPIWCRTQGQEGGEGESHHNQALELGVKGGKNQCWREGPPKHEAMEEIDKEVQRKERDRHHQGDHQGV